MRFSISVVFTPRPFFGFPRRPCVPEEPSFPGLPGRLGRPREPGAPAFPRGPGAPGGPRAPTRTWKIGNSSWDGSSFWENLSHRNILNQKLIAKK